MACCSMGMSLCLLYGPRSLDAGPLPGGDLYHPQLWAYLVVGACLLAATLMVEHTDTGWLTRVRSAALPLATGLAFALEKLLNTELG
eukprot:CAMPEP_0176222800 /NCGR_PEP_ID=MMETSP0121_2-20121125/20419_1 /TAXON_ID=160619 /ORGANISM="Kryptoperidinium foliaceum, Strain CCMP 1326" /LENGTH=86 /DNA_ID=CAMNT_0017562021 /DNA_START=12 /DNA_END=268 /DNA_ORIENTATION=-